MNAQRNLCLLVLVAVLCLAGCVRRTLTINTEPTGALVWLNNEEIGRSPATVDFLWYGDYDIVIRNKGCGTLITHAVLDPPWYQLPGIDFFAEVLYPGRIHDARSLYFTLNPETLPDHDALVGRALEFRETRMKD